MHRKRYKCWGLLAWLLLLPGAAHAEWLVFVQGYLGDAGEWRQTAVTTQLTANGWVDGGNLTITGNGVVSSRPRARGNKLFYTVNLPSEAPVAVQSRVLARYLAVLSRRHAGESLYLVGHSAGGIVARFTLVKHPDIHASALITIATPHLGTDLADLASAVGATPLGWFAPLIGGGTLNRSQGLYRDLAPERPGNLLFWLNRQPHPKMRYVSIVRASAGIGGDGVVPAYSQDMNNVLALHGSARRVVTAGAHELSGADGAVVVRILAGFRRT